MYSTALWSRKHALLTTVRLPQAEFKGHVPVNSRSFHIFPLPRRFSPRTPSPSTTTHNFYTIFIANNNASVNKTSNMPPTTMA